MRRERSEQNLVDNNSLVNHSFKRTALVGLLALTGSIGLARAGVENEAVTDPGTSNQEVQGIEDERVDQGLVDWKEHEDLHRLLLSARGNAALRSIERALVDYNMKLVSFEHKQHPVTNEVEQLGHLELKFHTRSRSAHFSKAQLDISYKTRVVSGIPGPGGRPPSIVYSIESLSADYFNKASAPAMDWGVLESDHIALLKDKSGKPLKEFEVVLSKMGYRIKELSEKSRSGVPFVGLGSAEEVELEIKLERLGTDSSTVDKAVLGVTYRVINRFGLPERGSEPIPAEFILKKISFDD